MDPSTAANTPVRPIRFGIADLWLLTGLVAIHIAAVIKFLQLVLGHTDRDIAEKIVEIAVMCTATVAGAAYLAFRTSTEERVNSLWQRGLRVVLFEAIIVSAVTAVPLVMGTSHLLLPFCIGLAVVWVLCIVLDRTR